MLINLVQLVVGLAGLVIGGNLLVSGASSLARSFGISTLIIGLTIVAYGTSAPELLVNISAAINGSTDLAVGNVVGSNIANIGLILGVSGLLTPLSVQSSLVRRELPLMIAAAILTFLVAADGTVTRVDGLLLFGAFVAFNLIMIRATVQGKAEEPLISPAAEPVARSRRRQIGRVLIGIVVLVIGAQLTVTGASSVARSLGVSELVIGISLIAVGTSLPELAASMIAAMRKENDLTIGNVVGSNVTNLLAIMGLVAIFQPIAVPTNSIRVDMPVMVAFSFLVLPFAWTRSVLSRRESALFIVAYVVYIAYTFANQ